MCTASDQTASCPGVFEADQSEELGSINAMLPFYTADVKDAALVIFIVTLLSRRRRGAFISSSTTLRLVL